MLLVDHRSFHKHSTNPKTGRKYWKCSRRRTKDVRCPSSCHTFDDFASVPTPHDPSCMPLSNAEMVAYENRKGRFSMKLEPAAVSRLNQTAPVYGSNTIKDENFGNQDVFNETYQGFQNGESYLDEEQMVLNDLESNNDNENQDLILTEGQASIGSLIKDITVPDDNQANATKFRPILPKPGCENGVADDSKLKYITSKVGHPMLVVDDYSFHKHSINAKTGRVNWRCSRRRVKDIRCPSSCFTENGINGLPTPHHVNCYPMSAPAEFRNQQSYSTPHFNRNNGRFNGNCTNKSEFEYTEDGYDTFDNTNDEYCDSEIQFDKSTMGQNEDMYNGYRNDEFDSHSDGGGNNGDYNGSEDKHQEEDYLHSNSDFPHSVQTDEVLPEYNSSDYSAEPESFAKLISDLNDMKRRERLYRERLANSDKEVERIKGSAMKTIQSMKWKTKMNEIDMFSLKASLHQKNTQNVNLRKLVDEMMAKVSCK